MFLFKKIVGPFFYPVPLCLVILLAGVLLLWCTRRQRAGKVMVSLGTGLLAFLSLSWGPNLLLKPLEHHYPPLLHAPADHSVKWIVVLAGGVNADPRLPATSAIGDATLYRVLEAVRLYRDLPGSKLILSGGSVFGAPSEAEVMAKVCRIMAVNPGDVILETASRDTEDQARLIQEMVGRDKLVLVTSASHLPRSVALFRKRGMNPLPAPAGEVVSEDPCWSPDYLFPSARGLQKVEIAVHEYLGLAWAWLRGKI